MLLHTGIVYWMLHEQIRALAGLLREGVGSQWTAFRHHADDELGEADGHGTAIAPSEGASPASGREADLDQPFLSRDDEGMGRVGDAPSAYNGPTGGGALASAMQQPADDSDPPASFKGRPLEPETAIQPPKPKTAANRPRIIEGAGQQLAAEQPEIKPDVQPGPPAPQPERPLAKAPATPPAVPNNAIAMNSASGAASPANQSGLPVQSADPAPKGDSEIDPFSHQASIQIRDGKMVVQSGRKYSITRPRLTLAGRDYLIARGAAAVTLKLTLDEAGKVIRVDIERSSGSNDIDQPIFLAAHEWTFEPDKSATGIPKKTTFTITCGYQ